MLLSPRKNGLDSLFKEVRVCKANDPCSGQNGFATRTAAKNIRKRSMTLKRAEPQLDA